MSTTYSRGRHIALAASATCLCLAGCGGAPGSMPATNPAAGIASGTPDDRNGQSSKLYVSTIDGGSVVVYAATGSPTLLQTITDGVPRPQGIWVDRHGVLYAVNVPGSSYQTSLPEYKNGKGSPFQTITSGIVNCSDVAVDSKGTVYVSGLNTANGDLFIETYPKGQTAPSRTLTVPNDGLSSISGLAFDSTGALLVGETTGEGSSGEVFRLDARSHTFANLGLKKVPGGAIALDPTGNLYVGGNTGIAVYAPDAVKASRHIPVQFGVSALAIDDNGELYVGSFESVLEYAPNSNKPQSSFRVPGHVGGLALGS